MEPNFVAVTSWKQDTLNDTRDKALEIENTRKIPCKQHKKW